MKNLKFYKGTFWTLEGRENFNLQAIALACLLLDQFVSNQADKIPEGMYFKVVSGIHTSANNDQIIKISSAAGFIHYNPQKSMSQSPSGRFWMMSDHPWYGG